MADRDPGVRQLLELVNARGVPVHIIGGEKAVKVKPITPPPEPETRRGLPD